MIKITEEKLSMLASNASALSNGRKISQKNGFFKLYKSKDETIIFGQCSGSGKSIYDTSADFINEESPVFRCNCPSRQFPCKHSLGLMFDWIAGKKFEISEIPEDIIKKRSKAEEKKEKNDKKEPPKVNKAAAQKKMKKQLQGLELAEQFVSDIISSGISSLISNPTKNIEDIAKQMGDYYLPGIQTRFKNILLNIKETKNQDDLKEEFIKIINSIIQIKNIAKKGKELLSCKIEAGTVDFENSILYENMGTVWKLSQLKEMGLTRENVSLVQLSFFVKLDNVKSEYQDIGYWIDMDTGEISKTENFRPIKALKFVKEDDTVFDKIKLPILYYYPGEINKRIRFEEFSLEQLTNSDITKIMEFAQEKLDIQIKKAKNQIKNVLSDKEIFILTKFDKIGFIDNRLVLKQNDIQIEIKSRFENEDIINRLVTIARNTNLDNNVVAGELFYSQLDNKIYIMPHSIITQDQIIRILY